MSDAEMLVEGQKAPDFSGDTTDGNRVTLSRHLGKQRVVLVFYPGDFTPVCSAQLCELKSNWPEIQQQNTAVYGVNSANMLIHKFFANMKHLPFPLISDNKGKIAALYGSKGKFGSIRTVYLIDGNGNIGGAWRGNPPTQTVLDRIMRLEDNLSSK